MAFGPLITRLDRYIFRQLAFALIAVTGGLAALIWLTQSLRFVELVVNRGLSLGVFLELTGLLIPSFVAVILPITTLRRGAVRLSAPGRRPRADGDARRRPVAAARWRVRRSQSRASAMVARLSCSTSGSCRRA